jgi:phage terminase large subunit
MTLADAINESLQATALERVEYLRLEVIRRIRLLEVSKTNPDLVLSECARNAVKWVNDWVWTYDPRNPIDGIPAAIPMRLRPKQEDFLRWVDDRISKKQNGLIEKSRDEGMTWAVSAFFVHHWLFHKGFKGGIGSRKLDLVDRKGDPDSIFEKIRFIVRNLPLWMLPKSFNFNQHVAYCRLVNPDLDSSITGEGGENIGRGGRNTVYFVDEHAMLEQAETTEQALSQNAPCVLYGSTPRGVGNLFYQKRFDGKTPVFTFNWLENPDKNHSIEFDGKTIYPWYESQAAKYDAVTIAQEIDIDYTASVSGIVIPAQWVEAALKFDLEPSGIKTAGLDVSDEGAAETVYTSRHGACVMTLEPIQGGVGVIPGFIEEFAARDGITAMYYDRLGVGASITATTARKSLGYSVTGIANNETATRTKYPDLPDVTAEDRFINYAAELWWRLRIRFQNTFNRVNGIGNPAPDDECISLKRLAKHPGIHKLCAQLSQPTYEKMGVNDKIRVNKKGNGSSSPDHAESLMYTYAAPARVIVKPQASRQVEAWG